MLSQSFLKALFLLVLLPAAVGPAWSAEAPAGNVPPDIHNPGQVFEYLSGHGAVLRKAREAAGKPGGPVEVFFKRLRVEPSFHAAVKAKAFTQQNPGAMTATLLLVRADGREMLVHASEASGNELKLAEHLQLGQTYSFPQVCAAAGVPINPKAPEPPATPVLHLSPFNNWPQLRLPDWLEDPGGADPSRNPHFLASTLRKLPPFQGTVMKKASLKLQDGKVVVSLAIHRVDGPPLTITEPAAAPETAHFVEFLKEGETYDFPAILDKVDGVKFPPPVAGTTPLERSRAHPLFRSSVDFMKAQLPQGTLPLLRAPRDAPFTPGTAEEKALDHYVGEWGSAVQESSAGKYQKVNIGPMRTSRRWTADGKQIRVDGYHWHDLDASPEVAANWGRDTRIGFVAMYRYDPATRRFTSTSIRSDANGELVLKPANTGFWDEASRTFTWTPVDAQAAGTATFRTSFPEDGVMVTVIVERDSNGAVLGEQVTRTKRDRR